MNQRTSNVVRVNALFRVGCKEDYHRNCSLTSSIVDALNRQRCLQRCSTRRGRGEAATSTHERLLRHWMESIYMASFSLLVNYRGLSAAEAVKGSTRFDYGLQGYVEESDSRLG